MRLVRHLALGLLSLGLFVELVWLQLPGDRLSRSLENFLRPRLTGVQVELGKLETGVFGGQWDEIRLLKNGQELLLLEEVSVSLAPWYLLQGGMALEARLWGGELAAMLTWRGQPGLRLEAVDLSPARQSGLAQSGLVSGRAGLDLQVDLTLGQQHLQGQIRATGQDWRLNGSAKATGLFFDLPQLHVQEFQLQTTLGEAGMELDFKAEGDAALSLQGQIQYAAWEQLLNREGTLNLVFQAKPSTDLQARLGDVSFLLQGMQRPDGSLSGRIKGNLGFPQVEKL